jgi:hypothetical protein
MFFRRQLLICAFGATESAAETGGIGFVFEAAEGRDVVQNGVVSSAAQ